MKIRLNVATEPIQVHRRFLAGAGLVGFAATITLVVLAMHVYRVQSTQSKFRAEMNQIQADMQRLLRQQTEIEQFFSRPENSKLSGRAQFLNAMIDERSFNWTKMFMDLEKLLPAGVHVLSISPTLKNGRAEVKLMVGATSDENKLKFVRMLESSKDFKHIQVLAERAAAKAEGTDKILVDLSVSYL
jgi:Tfp pilus assembly protein PilN